LSKPNNYISGSPASTNPELNFLVYVPSGDQYPLYIKDDKGTLKVQ